MADPPYALFVIAEDINLDYINRGLTRAWEGNEKAGWLLWLATDSYNDVPRIPDDNTIAEGTEAPISTFTSPWVGRSLEDCVRWLQDAGDQVAVNKEYFAVMDQFSKEDDTILMGRVVGTGDRSDVKLQYYPVETEFAVSEMMTSSGLKFDEHLQNYQRSRMVDRKPDRSSGKPYEE